jgi:Uncharacterized protein conserved in archaea
MNMQIRGARLEGTSIFVLGTLRPMATSEEMVYERLLRVHAEELGSQTLAKMPEDLLEQLASYARDLRRAIRMSAEKGSLHHRIREKEMEVLRGLLSEILEKRLEKIVSAALRGGTLENALPFEAQLLQDLRVSLEAYRDLISQAVEDLDLRGKVYRRGNVLLVFTEDYPSVTDEEGRSRGPFKRGSIASLPPVLAQLVLDSGKARRLPSPQRTT